MQNDLAVMSSHSKVEMAERAFLVAGVLLLLYLVSRVGIAPVAENLRQIGWGFVLIIGQEAFAWLFNALGWYYAFPEARRPPLAQVLTARIAGDAINSVTPTATIGGEFVRARMIQDVVDSRTAWASVTVAKISQTVGQIGFIVLGMVLILPVTPLPESIRHGLMMSVVGFAVVIAVTLVLQRRGLFSVLASLAAKVGIPVSEQLVEHLRELDAEVNRLYDAPLAHAVSVGFFFLGWVMGAVEVYLMLHFLGLEATWSRALAIEVFSATIEAIFFFVPAKAGTQEGGKVLIFSLLGIPNAEVKGLSMGLARRIRDLVWAGIGLFFLSQHQWKKART